MSQRAFVFALCLALLLCCAAPLKAEPVDVFQPAEPDLGVMQLRAKARESAFAQAVFREALKLLPAEPGPDQQAKLQEYLTGRALQYVTGYQELGSAQDTDGLRLSMNVEVNRTALRDFLRRCGAYYTVGHPQPYDLVSAVPLTAEQETQLNDLALLGGLSRQPGAQPEFVLERGVGSLWKGTLRSAATQVSDMGADLPTLWLKLWGRWFATQSAPAAGGGMILTVSGWFSPDGAAEFHRVLRSWDNAVQDAQLLELDLQTSGVTGIWRVRVLDAAALDGLLKGYLPSRGLTQTLSGS